MNFDYKTAIPADFNDDSRVWIYQSSRLFTIQEAFAIEDLLNEFTANWKSHGATVKGHANLLYGQFIIILADETATGVSGCSTDSSVRVIKQVEEKFGVDMFNRQMLAFLIKEKVQLLPLAQINYALQNNYINTDTIYFNNLVSTKQELLTKWLVPVKESWLRSRIHVAEKV